MAKPRRDNSLSLDKEMIPSEMREQNIVVMEPALPETDSKEYTTKAELIARSKYFSRSRIVHILREHFPQKSDLWYVDKYFKHAKGGELYVDECNNSFEIEAARLKAKVMKENRYRYVWIEKNDTLESMEQKLKGEIK